MRLLVRQLRPVTTKAKRPWTDDRAPGGVGDRPDDRRVRRARRRARRGLPPDATATMRLLRADGQLIRVGHRGAARLAPENTVRSFEVAVEHGVDAIEFDVLDAGPGPLVLGHSLAELGPDPDTLDDALNYLAGQRRRRPRRPEADDAARRGCRRPRAPRRRGSRRGQLVPPAEPAGDRRACPAAADRLHLPRGPLRRLEAPRDEAGDPARHARAPAGDRRADPGDDRPRRCAGVDAAARGRLAGRSCPGARRRRCRLGLDGGRSSTSSRGSTRRGSMQ